MFPALSSLHTPVRADSLSARVGRPHPTAERPSGTTPLRGVPAHVAPPAPTSIPPREREKADDWKGGVFPRPGCGMRWELVAEAVRNCQLAPQGSELHRAGLLVSRVHL